MTRVKVHILRTVVISLIFITSLQIGCGDNGGEKSRCPTSLIINSLIHPATITEGSRIIFEGGGFNQGCGEVFARFKGEFEGKSVDFEVPAEVESLSRVTLSVESEFIGQFSPLPGRFIGEAGIVIRSEKSGGIWQQFVEDSFIVAMNLTPTIDSYAPENVNLYSSVSIIGNNFISESEGEGWVILSGTYETTSGQRRPVENIKIPFNISEQMDRTRGFFLYSPEIAGIVPGSFTGEVKVRNEQISGFVAESNTITVTLSVGRSFVTEIQPQETTLGGIVNIVGAGFIGATHQETMTLKLSGTVTPYQQDPRQIDGVELIGRFIDGEHVEYDVIPVVQTDHLIALDLGFQRGTFRGTITPILEYNGSMVEGLATNIMFSLGPIKQVVFVQFLDSFTDTLRLFGLKAVQRYVKERVIEKLRETYEGVNIEFRTDWPHDYYPGGYSIVEISGPDPNGKGMFGYDNTPGKDVWNLRLHDRIGGLNAETQQDGYPGYGGVFIDSILCWSTHPPEEVVCPDGFEPEPLFDTIFDNIREEEVVAGEYPEGSDSTRRAEIAEAIRVLGNLIGDTAAHEIGHSLGLAHPFGPPDLVHHEPPAPGCLMDAGAYRPFEERAELNGAPPGRWCGDEEIYLKQILPLE